MVGMSLFYSLSSMASEDETPVMFDKPLVTEENPETQPWQPPNYSGQEGALGYEKGVFDIPSLMEERVSFWIDIYTKFTTHQGLLHDSRYVHLVYEVVDFSDISQDESLSLRQKRRARRQRVKTAKKTIQERLRRLQKVKGPEGLEGEDLRYWHLFARIQEKNKFREASRRGRLRFQLGQKDRFYQAIFFSGRYLREMEDIFRSEGLPIELTRLPFVESSFNVNAKSKVGASGIWQFMRYTARRLLKMNYSVDERNDPLAATRAAARLLRMNFNQLDKWPLAVTAYNHGAAGVRRMVRRYKTDVLPELLDYRRGRFGFASANFYASFLAAVHVEKQAPKFFGELAIEQPLPSKKLTLSKNIRVKTLLGWFDGDLKKAKLFNPHLQRGVWKGWSLIQRRSFIHIPTEKEAQVIAEIRKLKNQKAPKNGGQIYRLSQGETLTHVARQFGVSVRSLIDVNGIVNPRRLRPGKKLVIPMR